MLGKVIAYAYGTYSDSSVAYVDDEWSNWELLLKKLAPLISHFFPIPRIPLFLALSFDFPFKSLFSSSISLSNFIFLPFSLSLLVCFFSYLELN